MHRDDRLFAIIGGAVVTAAAGVFLMSAGGITGTITNRPEVRVRPIPAEAAGAPEPDEPGSPLVEPPAIQASFETGGRGRAGDAARSLVAGLSAHPRWASWLVSDDLLRRFVLAVEAIADGYSPSDELGFLAEDGRFLVREDEGRLVIAAGTFRRYTLAVEVLMSIETDRAVELYAELEPEIEEIRRDLAWHRGDFSDRLRQAVDHLLEVEIPASPIEVERRTRSYVFADDRYERLSPAQRQLLRMGRDNAEAVRAKLIEVRAAFGWPEPEPHGTVFAVDNAGGVDMAPQLLAELDTHPPMAEGAADANESSTSFEPMLSPVDPRIGDQLWMRSPAVPPSAPVVSTLP
jgi:hypothetical protein